MADAGEQQPILAIKKFGAIFLVVIGLVLIGIGMGTSPWLTALGVLCLIVAAVLLALKVIRRNQL